MIIRAGRGWVEWRGQRKEIQAGQAFRLMPGEWHRYRPDPRTGWTEEWFEFRGPLVSQWLQNGNLAQPVYDVPARAGLRRMSREFHGFAIPGGRRATSRMFALALSIFVEITGAFASAPGSGETRQRTLVARACEALERGVEVGAVARALGVSYPTLHRYFREVLGESPKQFATRSRWGRAEEHLSGDARNMKEIAAGLGFHSASHFSLAFKKVYGCPPSGWRRQNAAGGLSRAARTPGKKS